MLSSEELIKLYKQGDNSAFDKLSSKYVSIINSYCRKLFLLGGDIDDLVQEVYVILLEYKPEKIIELWQNKQLKFFIVGIIKRQYHSKTSPFYKKYKKYYTIVDGNYVNNENNDMDDVE